MSPAQVDLQVRVRAQELGVTDYPSRPTVYRILLPLMEQRQRQKPLTRGCLFPTAVLKLLPTFDPCRFFVT